MQSLQVVMIRRAGAAVAVATLAAGLASRQPAPDKANAHLRADGTRFVAARGTTFQWRGITAFRLLDYVADGQQETARRYLAWAKSQGLTVVRVFAVLDGFFDLSADAGRKALPELLRLAAQHGLHVEVVGLTNTAKGTYDPREQIKAVGEIVARHPNALFELANEPIHPTQSPDVHRPPFLRELAATVAEPVPVSLGSIENDEEFAAADYVTWHSPRETGDGGWAHVPAVANGADLLRRLRKPLVSDEPIGAGPKFMPGRRDNSPDRFRAAALLTRLAGMGATFHYEGGLHARIPTGRELECFTAWNEAWQLLPADIEHRGVFRKAGEAGAVVRGFDPKTALAVFERQDDARAWVLVIRPGAKTSLRLAGGWSVASRKRAGGVEIITAQRSADFPK